MQGEKLFTDQGSAGRSGGPNRAAAVCAGVHLLFTGAIYAS